MGLCEETRSTEQELEAMNWYFGGEHCRSIQFLDDSTGDQAGKSFDLNIVEEEYSEVKYLLWLSDGVASAPTPGANQTLIEVSYSQDDDAETIAQAVETALAGKLVTMETDGAGKLEILNQYIGSVSDEDYTNATGIVMEVGKAGFGGSLGQLQQGGSSLGIEETVVQLLSDQDGSTVLDEIITGITATISMPLVEMTTQRWEDLIANGSGGKVESGNDKFIGYGTDKVYQSKFAVASGALIGHPIRKPFSDRSADIKMMKTAPKMTEITYSGQEAQVASFEFVSYKNPRVDSKVNLVGRGDWTLA